MKLQLNPLSFRSIVYLTLAGFGISSCDTKKETLFKRLDSGVTGIHFNNRIEHGDTLSVIDFEYMYNGAGVAIGDLNNDGLQDLFFTGNMVSSKLYLNRGNMQFEDITEKSGTATKTWANGVTMADFNQDGHLDIFLSVGGNRFTPEEQRNNLLFINNGNLTFTESASAYGLDDRGFGVHTALIDYDLDGDLDVYMLRNSFVNYSRNMSRPRMINGEAYSTDKLFRNNGNNTYTEVSREAGILIEGFGLGVNICDINDDGWPDVYVSNDFLSNDLIWINNQNGTFTNQAAKLLKHQTFNAMGNDVADYNNDGLVDIVVVDMLPEDNKRWKLTPRGNNYDEFEKGLRLGYEPQYIRNTLQLNNGNGTFSEVGQLAGIEATEWSWSALLADFDHDGWKDLFISNGYGKDITNQDFIVYGEEGQTMGLPAATKKERQDLLNKIPGVKLSNYIYRNNKDLTFTDETKSWGFDFPTYSNGAAYGDLDNDGDLDLVINNIDDEATVMENTLYHTGDGKEKMFLRLKFKGTEMNRDGYGVKVKLFQNGLQQLQMFSPWRGYLSTVEPFLHFGLETSLVDSLHIIWPDGRTQKLQQIKGGQTLTIKHEEAQMPSKKLTPEGKETLFTESTVEAGIIFKHHENEFIDFKVQPALPRMHSRNGPGLAVADLNGDQLEDFVVGAASGSSVKIFFQNTEGKFKPQSLTASDTLMETLGLLLFDADGDRDEDLYVVAGGSEHEKGSVQYQDKLFLNDGHGLFSLASGALPSEVSSGSCAIAADYDLDGDLDVLVGGRVSPREYPLPSNSMLLRNDSKGDKVSFTDVTDEIFPSLKEQGMVCAALWTDVDQDGWPDLATAGEFTPIVIHFNKKGRFEDSEEIKSSRGWWNSLTPIDLDKDGDVDLVAGNLGMNSHFKASPDEPLCVHAKDFNGDGRIDPMMSYYVQGENHLGHPRDVLIDQINSMRARFRSFKVFSETTFEESFLPEELEGAYVVCAETFQNSFLENMGKGKFQLKPLPLEAQTAPVYGVVTDDFNADGNPDILAIGNSYSPEVISGRDDASIGWMLNGDGKGNLKSNSVNQSGFMVDGDGKALVRITVAGKPWVLASQNNASLKAFRINQSNEILWPQANETTALVILEDGSKIRYEFFRGNSYLSSGSRGLLLPGGAVTVIFSDFKGKTREIKTGKK